MKNPFTAPPSPLEDHSEQSDNLAAEERKKLINRICSSQTFQKSPRLSELLRHIYRLHEKGRGNELSEQHIGIALFGRSKDYDPSDDSIVRSHASRLRRRLVEYFSGEGSGESLQIEIPRGAYIPHFIPKFTGGTDASLQEATTPQSQSSTMTSLSNSAVVSDTTVVNRSQRQSHVHSEALNLAEAPLRGRILFYQGTSITLLVLVLLLLGGIFYQRLLMNRLSSMHYIEHHPLWSRVLAAKKQTLVVTADSGAVILQGFTHHRVSLEDYSSGEYLRNLNFSQFSSDRLFDLGNRRYTSMVDLRIIHRLDMLLGSQTGLLDLRFSRDIHAEDLKSENAILLGTYESTPWVQLYEPRMNFYFQNDLEHGVFSIINRSPQAGERSIYDSNIADPLRTVYGIVAFQPGLSGTNNVLILEGQSMAGTQTASDFVFNDALLLPFLMKIRAQDGHIPHFELLLHSNSMGNESSQIDVVAYRVNKD